MLGSSSIHDSYSALGEVSYSCSSRARSVCAPSSIIHKKNNSRLRMEKATVQLEVKMHEMLKVPKVRESKVEQRSGQRSVAEDLKMIYVRARGGPGHGEAAAAAAACADGAGGARGGGGGGARAHRDVDLVPVLREISSHGPAFLKGPKTGQGKGTRGPRGDGRRGPTYALRGATIQNVPGTRSGPSHSEHSVTLGNPGLLQTTPPFSQLGRNVTTLSA